jgi:hypothetical protein
MKPIKLPRWFKRVLKRQYKRVWKQMLRVARGLDARTEFMIGVCVRDIEWKREKVPCWIVTREEFDRLPLKIKKRALPRDDLWNRNIPLVKIERSKVPWWVELLAVVKQDLKCPRYVSIGRLLRGIVIRDEKYLFIPEPTEKQRELIRITDTPRGYFDYIPKEIFDARIKSPEGTCYPLSLSR